jgi:hypothetical protein
VGWRASECCQRLGRQVGRQEVDWIIVTKRRKPLKPSSEGTCIFYGSPEQKLTAEHLFADWISWSFFPHRKPKQHTLWHRRPLDGSERRWKSASIDFKKPLLCNRCNNEILSRLENETIKPLLEPMMLRVEPTVLTIRQQRDFTSWIVSRMIVFNHMCDPEPHHFYSAAERKRFIETLEPPEGVQAWIGGFIGAIATESGPILGELSGFDPKLRPDVAEARKYVLTFSLRHFAVQLLAVKGPSPDAPSVQRLLNHDAEFVNWWTPRVVLPIWPTTFSDVSWPPRWIMGRGGYEQLAYRFGGVETPFWPQRANQRPARDFFVKAPRALTETQPRRSSSPADGR